MGTVTQIRAKQPAEAYPQFEEQDVVTSFAKGGDTTASVTRAAQEIAMCVESPKLLMLFVGGKHSPEQALKAVENVFPGIPVVGGSAAGVISRFGSGYSGIETGIVAWMRESITPQVSYSDALLDGDYEAGLELGRLAKAKNDNSSVVVLLYDSVRPFQPRQLHLAGSLVDGFYDGWGSGSPTVIGGGLLTDLNLTDGWVFVDGKVRRHAAIALSFPAVVKAETVVLRACLPVGSYMEITRIDGAEVYELNGKPALEVVESYLTKPLIDAEGNPNRILTLGHKIGDPYDDSTPDDYINRLILTGNRARGSITLFEPDFAVGDLVQIMASDPSLLLEEAHRGAQLAKRASCQVSASTPLMRLYINCAGRASVMSGTKEEDVAAILQELEDDEVPIMGFYSGVEIAPMKGRSRPLDWTGVLTTLMEKAT